MYQAVCHLCSVILSVDCSSSRMPFILAPSLNPTSPPVCHHLPCGYLLFFEDSAEPHLLLQGTNLYSLSLHLILHWKEKELSITPQNLKASIHDAYLFLPSLQLGVSSLNQRTVPQYLLGVSFLSSSQEIWYFCHIFFTELFPSAYKQSGITILNMKLKNFVLITSPSSYYPILSISQ